MSSLTKQDLPSLVSAKDLATMHFEKSEYLVSGLLRTGRRRISLLCGKPESGKSTLALQLAVAVAKGEPFLERETLRGEVLLLRTEEDLSDSWEALKALGYDHAHDEQIWLPAEMGATDPLTFLDKHLAANPKIRLVILETLDDVLRVQDLKDNTKAREAFERFERIVMSKYSERISVLALHHLKKEEVSSDGDKILGASVLRGKTDSKIYLQQVSDEDERRIIRATVRKGVGLPKTFLRFDSTAGKSELGLTVEEDRKLLAEERQSNIRQYICDFFSKNPHSNFEKDCLPTLNCNSDQARAEFKKLLACGLLKKSGTGKKNSPFLCTYERIPAEKPEVAA